MTADALVGLYVEAAYPIIAIASHEEDRVVRNLLTIAGNVDDGNTRVFTWSVTRGLCRATASAGSITFDQVEAAESGVKVTTFIEKYIAEAAENLPRTIFVLSDFIEFLTGSAGYLIARKLRDIIKQLEYHHNARVNIILLDTDFSQLPARLSKYVVQVEWPLPDKAALSSSFKSMVNESPPAKAMTRTEVAQLVSDMADAGCGLTLFEFENAVAKSLASTGMYEPALVTEEKRGIIKRSGHLEYWDVQSGLAQVGGLENLKSWLKSRRSAFTEDAKVYGLDTPKGVLLVGVPGCGKSLMAKAVGFEWSVPVLRLDIGKVMGSYIGQSERQIREALAIAEAVAPCVLWLDEMEKGLGGGGGERDGGTSSRVASTWLTWMQEKTAPVFVVATANSVESLPPEMLRAGRFDAMFYVDIPTPHERAAILGVQLRKRRRDPTNFDLDAIVAATEEFTGAELETLVSSAMFTSFSEGRELETRDIIAAVAQITPVARSMAEDIKYLRDWASTRAINASLQRPPPQEKRKAIVPIINSRLSGVRGKKPLS